MRVSNCLDPIYQSASSRITERLVLDWVIVFTRIGIKMTTAVWIFNKNYLIPTYISVASFASSIDLPLVLVSNDVLESTTWNKLASLTKNISILYYPFNQPHTSPYYRDHIINRLVRMNVVESLSGEDILYLFDSDTAFSPDVRFLIEKVNADQNTEDISMVWGVSERRRAADAKFYFVKKDSKGQRLEVPSLEMKHRCYLEVFGKDWEDLLNYVQFNNGVLAFHKCKNLAQTWQRFYLRGLAQEVVNPEDDQVPLSAAMRAVHCKTTELESYYNSRGKTLGAYAVYHANAGTWRWEILNALEKKPNLSDYGEIVKEHLHKVPAYWINAFRQDVEAYLKRVEALTKLDAEQ